MAAASDPSVASSSKLATQQAPDGKTSSTSTVSSSKLASTIRRNYIYFTSLLQEPEAKWKHRSESRGVTISQLQSIDPTLVVYRAEKTLVGVSLLDLYAAIATPGVVNSWDKGAEESRLLQDLGEKSKLWWTKTRGVWPVAARDSITVETCYRSPSSIHIFKFSTDDRSLFPSLPAPDAGSIRTQIDLRGWSMESLNPTTVHITLIEQSDPGGWTSKSSATPWAMTQALAGIGDFVIRQGGPPIATRLTGATLNVSRYEPEKSAYRIEYALAQVEEKSAATLSSTDKAGENVECEIRCNAELWAVSSIDIVVDPPPIKVRCLRRHKLDKAGDGIWITIQQPRASLEEDIARVDVRRGIAKEKGAVFVNGARIPVEVDELKEDEVAQLRDQKRSKPKRLPLDFATGSPKKPLTGSGSPPSTPPISRSGTPAVIARDTAAKAQGSEAQQNADVFLEDKPRHPMTCCLDVLFLLRRIHAERSTDPAGSPAGWTLVSQRGGLYHRRKLMQTISPTVAVQRSDKVVEGVTAEDLLSVIKNLSCRKIWDEKVDSAVTLESFGNGASTGFFTTKGSFPFRGRAFHTSSLIARSGPDASLVSGNPSAPTVYFHASSSYSETQKIFSQSKLNPQALPIGKVLIDGWILETLDPYSSIHNYQIPSTRVTHLIAIDYAGSLPSSVNTMWNTQLSRSITLVEDFVKARGTLPAVRSPPNCIQVLGDGRDDDHGLIWSMEDDRFKRACTLLSSSFEPSKKEFSVLIQLDRDEKVEKAEPITPLAAPTPRRATQSMKGLPTSASSFSVASSNGAAADAAVPDKEDPADISLPISRTTSMTSLRSNASKSRASVLRKEPVRKPFDYVLADVEVELRHYEKGYEIVTSSELGPELHSDDREDDDDEVASVRSNASLATSQKSETSKALSHKSTPSLSASLTSQKSKSLIGSTAAEQPLLLNSANEACQALPISVASYDMPPSAVLAATLDEAARPKKHLIRLILPTAAFLDGRVNPFTGSEPDASPEWYRDARARGATIRVTIKPHIGQASRATSENPASVDGASTPSSVSTDDAETDSQQIPVYHKGERIKVTHVNQTSAMLQRESDSEQSYAILKRIQVPLTNKKVGIEGASDEVEGRVPALLRRPLATALEYMRDGEDDSVDGHATSAGMTASASRESNALSAASSSGELLGGKTPTAARGASETPKEIAGSLTPHTPTPAAGAGAGTGASTSGGVAPTTPASAASAQIMSILNSYPLSRLGASTAVSNAVASGARWASDSQSTNDAKGTQAEDKLKQTAHANGVDGASAATNTPPKSAAAAVAEDAINAASNMPGQLIEATEQIRKRLVDVRFSLSTLVLVAIIAFLVGSLVRSLLEPADFVLVKRLTGEVGGTGAGGVDGSDASQQKGAEALQAVAVQELKRLFESGGGPGQEGKAGAGLISHQHTVAWRELKRLVELRNFFGGRFDLVIAAVRR